MNRLPKNQTGSKTYLSIKNNIFECRKTAGKTQAQIAKLLEIPRSSYAGIELGINLPTVEMLVRITNIFGCKTTDMYSETVLAIIHENGVK